MASVAEAVWRVTGKLMAYWLFWQTKTIGAAQSPAKFSAAWKSGWLVAPSPRKASTTTS